jgi:hypothetical protein
LGAIAPKIVFEHFWDLGRKLAHVGGNWNNGSNDGPSLWNLNNSSSNANKIDSNKLE